MDSELRIQSIEHANAMAKMRKQIKSVIDYDLAMAIDMASCDSWDISPDRVLRVLRDAETVLKNVITNDKI